MVSTSKVLVLACLLMAVVPITYSQEDIGWQVESVTFISRVVGSPYQISADERYIVAGRPWLWFINLDTNTREYESFHDIAFPPRWLNDTMIYREYDHEWYDQTECNDSDLATFGFFDATTITNTLYCLTPPASYVEQQTPYSWDTLERFPFDDHTVLVNYRYLVDLRAGMWQDIQGTLSHVVNMTDGINWMAHGWTWWDTETQQPMAHLDDFWEEADIHEIASQSILLCPMEDDECQTFISIQNHVHGSLSDYIISPDGQTILWSAIVFADGQPVVAGRPALAGSVTDVAAFATDVQTSTTTEIFRLSDYNTRNALGVKAQWAEDGLTLAIDMNAVETADNGLLLVQFSR